MAPHGHAHGHGGKKHGHGKQGPAPLYDLTDGASAADKEIVRDVEGEDMRVCPTEHAGFKLMIFYNICAGLGFILLLVAVFPVPLYKANDGEKWTIWKGGNGKKWSDTDCDHMKQMMAAVQGFALSAMVFGLFNLVASVLHILGKGHMGLTMLMGFVATGLSLTSWALMVHQFHRYNCYLQPVLVHQSKLDAAFALTITAFGLQFFAIFSLSYYVYQFYALSEFHKEDYRPFAGYAALLSAIALIITCVGSASPLWESWFLINEDTYEWGYTRIGLWHHESFDVIYNLPMISPIDYDGCSTMKSLNKVGQAFSIISGIVVFAAYLCCIGAVYKPFMKFAALGASAFSCITLLVLWACLVGLRYAKCNDQVVFEGYTMTEGIGMFTSAWVAMVIVVLLLAFKV